MRVPASGTFAESGAVAWQFEQKGLLVLSWETPEDKTKRENAKWNDKDSHLRKIGLDIYDEIELELIDTDGVQDIQNYVEDGEGSIEILTSPEALGAVRNFLKDKSLQIESMELIKAPKNEIVGDDALRDRIADMSEKIEEHEDVQNVWTNLT